MTKSRTALVSILVAASFISYMDRQVITVLLEPIQRDLQFDDTAAGLLLGTFFAFFSVFAGIPFGRLADKGDRRLVLSICLAGWSAATALAGLAQNFFHMAITRAFVAIGEAGATPVSASLVGEMFPADHRTRIFAMISTGAAAGIAFGVLAGGLLSPHVGWRGVFFLAALPGIALSLILLLLLREPPRQQLEKDQASETLASRLVTFWKIPTYKAIAAVTVSSSLVSNAMLAWMPTFLARVHGMAIKDVGASLGATLAVGLIAGLIACGAVADRLSRSDRRWLAWVQASGLAVAVPLGLAVVFTSNATIALITFGVFSAAMAFSIPPTMTIAVGLVSGSSRGTIAATIPALSAIGTAQGPLIVGILNDSLAPVYAEGAVRYSLAVTVVFLSVGVLAALAAAMSIPRDYHGERAEAP